MISMQRRTLIQNAAASLAFPSVFSSAQTQTLPSGSIRIIVGFPPGGGTDALARVLAQKLQVMWGSSIIVENKAGAAGVIAADYVSKQSGDGNTLLMGHINSHALAPAMGEKLSYDAIRDFAPISMVGITPMLLICNPDQPAKTLKDVVELCRKNPGQISFASAGGGSAQQFALEMFKLQAKISALHVPYRGSGPAIIDLMAGQVNYCFETMTSAAPHVNSGKLIAIAQTRLKRAKAFPNVPTMDESGFKGYEATVWYGLMGPKKMQDATIRRMNEDVNKVFAMPDVQERMGFYGAEDGGGSIEKFANFIKSEQIKWTAVAKAANVKADA